MRLSHEWFRAQPVFDEEHLVSHAGLVPVMALAERAGLSELVESKVKLRATRVKSAGANPAAKVGSIVAGMAAGADCIEHVNVLRAGGMAAMFGGVYAPATLGQFLREFTHGHGLQLASVLRGHLAGLVECSNLLPGRDRRTLVDIDSLLRPVYGHAKQGASYGHTKIAGRQVLRKGLSPLITTISTDEGAPVIAGIRLRAGKAGSGKGAAKMVAEAINTAREAGATGEVLLRGDSAYGNSAVVAACQRAGARFSLVITRNRAVDKAIASIPDDAWTAVKYPGAVIDPDTGQWISDAQVAEVAFTAFASTKHPVKARLIVRRVRDQARLDELFPVWRFHPPSDMALRRPTASRPTDRESPVFQRARRPTCGRCRVAAFGRARVCAPRALRRHGRPAMVGGDKFPDFVSRARGRRSGRRRVLGSPP